ncbi:MAG: amidohydrolase family protein [Phycisphaerae bacterium]
MSRSQLAAAWAAVSLIPVAAHAEFKPPVALVHARVVAPAGPTLTDTTILITDGRISAVGQALRLPPGCDVFDASELTVYPGFIDGLSFAGQPRGEPSAEERARVEDDYPDVRDGPHAATVRAYRRLVHPRWRAAERFDPKLAKLDDLRRLGITCAAIAPPPAIFAGRADLLLLGNLPLRRSLLRTDTAQLSAFVTGLESGDFPRGFDNPRYPTTLMGAMALFRQVLSDAEWQQQISAWAGRHPRAERPAVDADLDALQPVREGRQPVVFLANRENEILRALDMAAEFKLRPIIAGAREGWKVAERLKREQVPVIVSLKWSDDPEPAERDDRADATSQPDRAPASVSELFDRKWEDQPWEPRRLRDERRRLWQEEVDNARQLHAAGVPFAIGSFEHKSPEELLKNLRKAIASGLPASAAVAALSTDAARLWGANGDIGEIAVGQLGNLAVFTGPIEDEKSKVRCVFVEGQRIELGEPVERLREHDGRRGSDKRDSRAANAGTSAPATTPASAPSAPGPDYAVEIEADRKPRLHTNGNLLLRNVNVLPVTAADQMHVDLLIRDGKIAQIGSQLAAPAGVTVLDLPGYYVMPGIIDPHSHMCSDGGLNEFSMSITCEVRVRDVLDHKDIAAFRALAGGCTCIHTMHGSANTIGGQNATLRLRYGRPAAEWLFAAAPRTVKFALGENVKQSNFGTRGSRFPNTRMGVEAVLRRAFDAAVEYQHQRDQFAADTQAGKDPKPPRRDLRLEALADILAGRLWVHCHCYRADEILRLLAVAEDFGFRISVLQHVLEGYRVIPEMLRHGCGASTFSDWWGYKIEAFDAVPQNAARMTQGGVCATVNSDSPELVRHLNLEAAKSLHFGGLPAGDALKLCTLNGAIQLGVEEQIGSIEVGKLADLAVFDAHPLDTFSKCVLTLIDGEVYFQHATIDAARTPPAAKPPHTFAAAREPLKLAPSPGGVYVIRGATVHRVSGPAIDNGVVVIKAGRIESVASSADAARNSPPLPAGAVEIDAKSLHLFPGLINAGTSLGLAEIDSVSGSVDAADIGSFQPDLSPLSAFNPFSSTIEVARAAGLTSALLWPGGVIISGRAGVVRLDGWSMPEARVADGVALCVSLPTLPPQRPRDLTDEERKQQREQREARRVGLVKINDFFRRATEYADQCDAAGAAKPPFDRVLDAMRPYVRGQKPVFFAADSYKEIREALKFAEFFKLRPIIYGGHEAWKAAAEIAAAKADVVVSRTQLYQGEDDPWDSPYTNPAALAAAGVRFAFAEPDGHLAKLLPLEAGTAVAHGLGAERALRALTLDAAAILGLQDQLGSIDPGKVANLVLCTDSPMQASNHVVALFIDGRPVSLESRHDRLDAQFLRRPAPQLPPRPELRGRPAIGTAPAATPAAH